PLDRGEVKLPDGGRQPEATPYPKVGHVGWGVTRRLDEIAAALAKLLQGDTPFLLQPPVRAPREERAPRERFDRGDRPERGDRFDRNERGPRFERGPRR
ncbi:hypothetical protein J8J17_21505, partial [Mycobacterium tuberculosis]|nr:hypothetical protein [Mycobacterium tuberculosis]